MRGLIVTAHLVAGYCASDPWSPTLDGILAWAWMRRHHPDRLAEGVSRGGDVIEPDLPLARIEHGEHWWWACSSPFCETLARTKRHYHRRFDDDLAARYLDESVRKVPVQAGPYKSSRLAETIHLAPALEWAVTGDCEALQDLLDTVGSIGRGTARGYGRVEFWSVTEADVGSRPNDDRPVPEDYAAARGLPGQPMLWTLRPPGHARPPLSCVMPGR